MEQENTVIRENTTEYVEVTPTKDGLELYLSSNEYGCAYQVSITLTQQEIQTLKLFLNKNF